MELFIVSLAPLPGIEDMFIEEYYPDWPDPITKKMGTHAKLYVNWILLAAAMIMRMYLLIRFLITFTRFRSARQQRLCLYSNDTEADFLFAIKAIKEDSPYAFTTFALCIPLVALAYCVRIFERPLIPVSS